MAGRAAASAVRQPRNRWDRLAAVARERADEEAAKARAASDGKAAGPFLEQQAHLVRLAEVYEVRARDGAMEA